MIQGLILAAGSAQRYGGHKLLVKLSKGVPMVKHVLDRFAGAVDSVAAVVREGDHALIELLQKENVAVLIGLENALGMGHSIAQGVTRTKSASGWVIALADMPFIKPETFQAVANSLRKGARIAVPTYHNERGHPVGFASALYNDLIALSGDQGARNLFRTYARDLVLIPCEDPAIHIDIDTPQDLENHRQQDG